MCFVFFVERTVKHSSEGEFFFCVFRRKKQVTKQTRIKIGKATRERGFEEKVQEKACRVLVGFLLSILGSFAVEN